jgi:hypothetical protein
MKTEYRNFWPNLIIGTIALLNVIIHIVFSYNLEYHRDELLYFSLGQHPACGYNSVPPMIGWIAWTMKSIFGYNLFAVRIFPALLGGMMILLVSAIARELGGSGFSRILAATGMFVSITGLRTFLMFQPVHIDLIFWTLIFFILVKYINTSNDDYLILLGTVAGLAMLNKYLIAFLLIILILIVPFTRYRTIFSNKKFWIGVLVGFLVFLPNLIWQFANGLPVIGHMAELERTQLVNVSRKAFLIEQLAIPGAASILTVAGLFFLFTGKKVAKYRFLGLVVLSVIITLMLLQGKSYYTQGIFPFLIAAGAVSWEIILQRTWSRTILVLLLIAITVPVLPIGIPIFKTEKLTGYFKVLNTEYGMDFVCRFEDNSIHSLPQDYADMLGWEELAAVAYKGWQLIPDKKAAFIFCENYGQAGAITVIGKKYGLPEAISFSESFQYWIPEKFNAGITSGLYIGDEPGDDVRQYYRKITTVGSIENPDAREYMTTVYLCEDPAYSFQQFWNEVINRINNE